MFRRILKPKAAGINWEPAFPALLFIILLVQRSFPYAIYGPFGFGYDTGIYKHTFEGISSIPDIFTSQVSLLPSAIAYFVNFLGLPMDLYLYFFYILASAFIAIPLYFLTKDHFGKDTAILAFALFIVSTIQVLASQFFLFKAMMGASFMLFALLYYCRKSYLFYVFALLLAFTQLPQMLILLVAVSLDAMIDFKKNKWFFVVGIVAAGLIGTGIYLYNFELFKNAFDVVWSSLSGTGQSFDSHQSGLFMSIPEYFSQALYIFLLGVGGIFLSYKKDRVLPLQTSVIFVMVIVFWQLFFENRFLVEMDLLLIPFAAYLVVFSVKKYLLKLNVRRVVAGFLLIGVLISSFIYYRTTLPGLTTYEAWAIQYISEQKDGDYVFVTDTRYAPWVYGFAGKETIAPGIFHSVWDFENWVKYQGASVNDKTRMLTDLASKYGKYYLFEGYRQLDQNFETESERINKIFAVQNAVVYEVLPE